MKKNAANPHTPPTNDLLLVLRFSNKTAQIFFKSALTAFYKIGWSWYLNRPPALNYAEAGVAGIGGEFVGFRSAFSEGEIKARKAGIGYLPPAVCTSLSLGREWKSLSLRDLRESETQPKATDEPLTHMLTNVHADIFFC